MTEITPPNQGPKRAGGQAWAWVVLFIIVVAVGGGLVYLLKDEGKPPAEETPPVKEEVVAQKPSPQPQPAGPATKQIESGVKEETLDEAKVIELGKVKQDKKTAQEMARRKEQLGLKEGVEGVVKEEESIKVGGKTVPMSRIAAKIRSSQHQVKEESLGKGRTVTKRPSQLYGVYVVKPGDNLWNIHFRVLREYFGSRGIKVSKKADEPNERGISSGVGRILKYAERMVFIYSCKTDELCDNLDVIHANDKVVVFNMTEIDKVLRQLDAEKIKKIHFDGTNIYAEE